MKQITKIVTFYNDGTFEESTPSKQQYLPSYPPMPVTNPWPITNPWPPYTVTCKLEDGSIKTFETGGIFAQKST